MAKVKDLIGKKFNYLTVIEQDLSKEYSRPYWICKCDCGNIISVCGKHLAYASTTFKSCGCLRKNRFYIDGRSNSQLYKRYKSIKDRCLNKNNKSYKYYGGRGITMCKEWINDFTVFSNWAINNGYKNELTIDRINNNKGYCPENCRWTTIEEQHNNTRKNRNYIFNGEKMTISQISKLCNVNYETLRHRLNIGLTIEQATKLPIQKGIKKTSLLKSLNIRNEV